MATQKEAPRPTGIPDIDRLAELECPRIDDYIRGVSAYVDQHKALDGSRKKASQLRLSNALARAVAAELEMRLPFLHGRVLTQERKVAGALRTANADVSEPHPLDGLRLAIEIKPINLAVGRAIWNRFGDIRTFAVNIHLKFPFAVVGGVLAIPTFEWDEAPDDSGKNVRIRRSTLHLIERVIERLNRAGGRRSEADAPHLLEAIAVIAYDPGTRKLRDDIPASGSGLRWEEFIAELVASYRARFEE